MDDTLITISPKCSADTNVNTNVTVFSNTTCSTVVSETVISLSSVLSWELFTSETIIGDSRQNKSYCDVRIR